MNSFAYVMLKNLEKNLKNHRTVELIESNTLFLMIWEMRLERESGFGAVGLPLHVISKLKAMVLTLLMLSQPNKLHPTNFSFSQNSRTWRSHVLISSSMTSIV